MKLVLVLVALKNLKMAENFKVKIGNFYVLQPMFYILLLNMDLDDGH